jgi:sterol desaturase/sphingolipid hydroxylase (fatty acid hydroxylase superfamily)
MTLLLFCLGLLAWSLAEYLVHRFVLHRFYPRYHAIHHKDPLDGNGVSYSLAARLALIALVCAYVMGVFPLVAGVVAGYVLYVVLHEGMHRWHIAPGHWLYGAKQRHDVHHKGWRFNYGVTSPLWDVVFGTHLFRLEGVE